MQFIHLSEGLRMVKRSINVHYKGYPKYKGNAKSICTQILDDCYNTKNNYFQVSTGHFCEFYSRDFGWIVKSLLQLGYREQVTRTLSYALGNFRAHDRIRVAISPKGVPFDFPNYAVDSVPYIVYALAELNDPELTGKYKQFLEREILHLYKTAVDKKTGLVRKDKTFSSMKDHAKRQSSCYDACMLYLLQQSCKKLQLNSQLEDYNYPQLLKKYYWKNDHFVDDLSGKDYLAGDAQVFPFWTGAITDQKMLLAVIKKITKEKLDQPLSLRYTVASEKEKASLNFYNILSPEYERHTVWTHMGILYLHVLKSAGTEAHQLYVHHHNVYRGMIESLGTFPEVLNPDCSLYKSTFYFCDTGMSWCANYLSLQK